MPIWLRNTTFKLINEFYEKQNEAQEKASSSNGNSTIKTLVDADGKVNAMDFKAASQQYSKTSYK